MRHLIPRFFVIGTQKAGTTTLHYWLSRQGDVVLPMRKETHFFSRDDWYARGIPWYLSQFPPAGDRHVPGEVDPDYLFFEKTPERIRQHIKAPKIIAVFRHPIDRAYSQYLMSVRRGHEKLSFPQAVRTESERLKSGDRLQKQHFSYLSRSFYTEQVKRYLSTFPKSAFLFLKFDDLFNPKETAFHFKKICDFIGSSGSLSPIEVTARRHPASKSRFPLLTKWLITEYPWKKMFYIFPEAYRRKVTKGIVNWNTTPMENTIGRVEIKGQVPEGIVQSITEDIAALEDITGLNLGDWMKDRP